MANEVNSFTETVQQLIEQTNIALEFASKTNKSLTTQEDSVKIYTEEEDPITGDSSIVTYSIPSYNKTINQVNNLQLTMDTFIKGDGKILLGDGTNGGTYREVKTIPVAIAPPKIINVNSPTSFSIKSNWFFESLMFPQLIISFDLKNKIDDRSDRVLVRRLIFDNTSDTETQWFLDNIASNPNLSYYDTISLLNSNNKKYWLDEETQNLPLFTRPYSGSFNITDKKTYDNKEWYVLNTLNYGIPSDEPLVKNLQLAVGDYLRYENTTFKIDQINVAENRIHVIPKVGMDSPTIGGVGFEMHSLPFTKKIIELPVGYNECNSIFIKGINDDYNLIADEWSNAVSFYSNELIIEGGVTTLESYYFNFVVDFGKQMEGQAKENAIPAYFGVNPDAPIINTNQFEVKQINTQINASLDATSIKNTQSQIESAKTGINSLKITLAQQKAELVESSDVADREDLQKKINANVSKLSNLTVQYQSLVKSLATLAYENDAVLSNPKYRLRGFFEIPEGKTITNNDQESIQEIIQFDVAYRYLKLDNTGTALDTFIYIDTSTGQSITGTFTDWTITQSPIKSRSYNETLKKYEWDDESIADGGKANINQVDIPIQKGEKVQLKIRSISEAGWPSNSLKSEWSSTIISEFPANLTGSNSVFNILLDAQAEEANIKLEETLNAAGIYTHLQDGFPNPSAGADGTYFKHRSKFIAYDLSSKDIEGIVTKISTIDLQSQLDNLSNKTNITLSKPAVITSGYQQLSGTLQQLLQAMVNADPSIYTEFESLLSV